MLNVTITVTENVGAKLRVFVSKLRRPQQMNLFVGNRVRNLIREHVARWGSTHHATAQKLGASPTNFVAGAVRAIDASQVKVSGNSVTVPLPHPFFARAFGPVTIKPKGRALTIPMTAEAYGKRAGSFSNLFAWRSKEGKAFLAESKPGAFGHSMLKLWYALVPSVTQAQDASRLPSGSMQAQTAQKAVADFVRGILKQKAVGRG